MNKIEFGLETRRDLVTALQGFFAQEWDEDVSEFRAAGLLDFILDKVGPKIYNEAIGDAHSMMVSMLDNLYALEKRDR